MFSSSFSKPKYSGDECRPKEKVPEMKQRAHDCTVTLQNLVSTECHGRRHVNRPPKRDEKLQPGEEAEQLEDKKAGQAHSENAQQPTTQDAEATCDSAY